MTSFARIRSTLLEGSVLTNTGQDYRRAWILLRRGLADASTNGFPKKLEDYELTARSWNALGHVSRELGGDSRWSASFHKRASTIWEQVGNHWEASLALFSAAHALQNDQPNAALRLIDLARNNGSSRNDPTVEAYAETRIAQVLESQGANDTAARHYMRNVVPVCQWNDIQPEWAAISLIASSESLAKIGKFDSSFTVLEAVQFAYKDGLAANLLIESDYLGAELQLMVALGEEDRAYKEWARLTDICLQNGYPITNHIWKQTLLHMERLQ